MLTGISGKAFEKVSRGAWIVCRAPRGRLERPFGLSFHLLLTSFNRWSLVSKQAKIIRKGNRQAYGLNIANYSKVIP